MTAAGSPTGGDAHPDPTELRSIIAGLKQQRDQDRADYERWLGEAQGKHAAEVERLREEFESANMATDAFYSNCIADLRADARRAETLAAERLARLEVLGAALRPWASYADLLDGLNDQDHDTSGFEVRLFRQARAALAASGGKNPPVFWKDLATERQAQIERLTDALTEAAVDLHEIYAALRMISPDGHSTAFVAQCEAKVRAALAATDGEGNS